MNPSVTRSFKSLLGGALLALSVCAWALPTPKDIEASVQAGQLHQAEMQLREVLAEKPQSARAQYELGQVLAREGKFSEAETALQKARQLEPSLKFAASPQQFEALLGKVSAAQTATKSSHTFTSPDLNPQPANAPRAPLHVAPPAPAHTEPAVPWTPILLGLGVLVAWMLWRHRPTAPSGQAHNGGVYTPDAQPAAASQARGFGQAYAATPDYPAYPAANTPRTGMGGMGSTVGGAVVGSIAGLAAGYALSKALEGEHTTAAEHTPAASGPLPTPQPSDDFNFSAPRSNPPDFGSFDAGSGDSWDSGGSGSDEW